MSSLSPAFSPGSKVVAYLRDSGGQQQDFSIRQQKSALEKWALQNQVEISLFYIDEARSGTTTAGRTAFQNMINHFRQPMIKEVGLVLYSFSRFARDINSAWRYKGEIRSLGYKIVSLTDNIPDDDDIGPVIEFITDITNASHSKRDAVEATRGLHYNLDQYGCIGGTPPKGFKRQQILIGQHRGGGKRYASKWVPDPDTWEICRLAWQLRLDGKSYREINSVCKLFKDTNSYVTFFRNRLYCGDLIFGGKVYENYVEPMIDRESWTRVQGMFNPHNNPRLSEQHPRRAKSSFLLSGLVFCARCGAPLNGNVIKHSNNDDTYGYYFCSRAKNRKECDALRIPKEALEAAVFEKVNEYILNPKLVYERQKALLEEKTQLSDQKQIEIKELRKRITAQKTKINNLLTAIEDEDAEDLPSLKARLRLREAELRDLASQLGKLLIDDKESTDAVSPDQAAEIATKIAKDFENADPEKLRILFSGQIKSIEVEKDRRFVRGSISFYGPPRDFEGPGADGGVDPNGSANFMPTAQLPPGAPSHRHKIYSFYFIFPVKVKK